MKTVVRAFFFYSGAAALSVALTVVALRLWQTDLHSPMHYGWDTLPNLAWVKGVADHGWFLFNPSLGAPFGLDMRDFPLLDNLHFLIIKALAAITSDPALLLNLFFLLGFPLTTLTALWTMRRFDVSAGPALVVSLLYTFLPYHFFRGEAHVFLAAYFLVPPLAGVVLDIVLDRGVLLSRDPTTDRASWNLSSSLSVTAVLVCFLVSGAGVYYAFFGLVFLFCAGVLSAWRLRRSYPLGAAAILCGLLFCSSAANGAPSLLAWAKSGTNPAPIQRQVRHAEAHGLRLTSLFAPIPGHYVPWLARVGQRCEIEFLDRDQQRGIASLGVVGCFGLLYLLTRLLPRRENASVESAPLMDALAWLTLAALLLGLAGGGGALFNFTVTPIIRCYNRISIYLAFFCLFAVALLLDRLAQRLSPGVAGVGLVLLLLAGFLDQTGRTAVPDHAAVQRSYRHDADFFARLEALAPAGTMVFQLPYMAFPEAPPHGRIDCCYEHLRPYIHTRTLRWSYGGMWARYGDVWQARLAQQPIPELLDALVLAGFGGLLLDRRGIAQGQENQVRDLLGATSMESPDGRMAFYALREHQQRRQRACSAKEWQERSERVRLPVLPTWQGEVSAEERAGPDRFRWIGRQAAVTLHNPSDRRRRVKLTLTLTPRPGGGHSRRVWLEGVLEESRELRRDEEVVVQTLDLPPGDHVIHLRTNGTVRYRAAPPRQVAFGVKNLLVVEETPAVAPQR
jgi:phosphoglycerol transferase